MSESEILHSLVHLTQNLGYLCGFIPYPNQRDTTLEVEAMGINISSTRPSTDQHHEDGTFHRRTRYLKAIFTGRHGNAKTSSECDHEQHENGDPGLSKFLEYRQLYHTPLSEKGWLRFKNDVFQKLREDGKDPDEMLSIYWLRMDAREYEHRVLPAKELLLSKLKLSGIDPEEVLEKGWMDKINDMEDFDFRMMVSMKFLDRLLHDHTGEKDGRLLADLVGGNRTKKLLMGKYNILKTLIASVLENDSVYNAPQDLGDEYVTSQKRPGDTTDAFEVILGCLKDMATELGDGYEGDCDLIRMHQDRRKFEKKTYRLWRFIRDCYDPDNFATRKNPIFLAGVRNTAVLAGPWRDEIRIKNIKVQIVEHEQARVVEFSRL